jgi:hypothetical protein
MSVQLTPQQKADVTAYINSYRSMHHVDPLVWDETIATFTGNWAATMLSTHNFRHSGSPNYGENIAYFQGYGQNAVGLIKKAVDLWYNEVQQYDFANPGFSAATGHFTCLVWKASNIYSIAVALDLSSNLAYVSMNTYPPGNVIGQFAQNVFSATIGTIPPPLPAPITPVPSPIVTQGIISVNKKALIQQLEYVNYLLLSGSSKYVIMKAVNAIIYNVMNITST